MPVRGRGSPSSAPDSPDPGSDRPPAPMHFRLTRIDDASANRNRLRIDVRADRRARSSEVPGRQGEELGHFPCSRGRVRSHVEGLAARDRREPRPRRPDLRRRPRRSRRRAGAGARRRVRARAGDGRRRSRTRCSTAQKPDLVFDVVVPAARSDVVTAALRQRRARAVREADGGLDGRGAGAGRARRRDAGGCTRSSRTAASSRACGGCGGWSRSGTLGRAHRRALRLLHRRAFRRLPRGDGARAAARHGDPHLRRGPLHDRARRRARSIATRPTRRAPGTRTAPRPTPSSSSRAAWSSPIAARGAPRAPNTSWESALADHRHQGHAALGRRRRLRGAASSPATEGFLRETEAGAGARAGRPGARPRATPASSATSSTPSSAAARPRPSATDNIKSLAMVFGAIESARDRPARRPSRSEGSPMTNPAQSIRIGTMISGNKTDAAERIGEIAAPRLRELRAVLLADHQRPGPRRARQALPSTRSATATSPSTRSACSATRSRTRAIDRETLQGWKDCIDNAHHFGADRASPASPAGCAASR